MNILPKSLELEKGNNNNSCSIIIHIIILNNFHGQIAVSIYNPNPYPKISSHWPLPSPSPQISKSSTTGNSNSSSSATTTTRAKKIKSAGKRPKPHHRHRNQIRQKHQESKKDQSLLPGLPDHVARICLSLVAPSTLYSVCRAWSRLIYSQSFPPFLSIYALLIPAQTSDHFHEFSNQLNSVKFSCFDPISSKWLPLPSPPPDPPLRFLLRHPSFISRRLPIQSVSVSGKLVLLAATADLFQPALSCPLIFDPFSRSWSYGPPFVAPRRWCAAGSSAGTVYVASGVGSHYNQDTARSVEKWDPRKSIQETATNSKQKRDYYDPDNGWEWEKMGGLKDGKFSRDAIDAVGWRGKLCMVNVKGDTAKEGATYDVKNDSWEEMPEGMLVGWRGPAASMDEETIYVVNESKGVLRKYDPEKDSWVDIYESKVLKGAQFMAAGGGKACIVGGSAAGIVVVDVEVQPCRVWSVHSPPGFQPVSIHVLPRMSQQEEFESAVPDSMCEEQ